MRKTLIHMWPLANNIFVLHGILIEKCCQCQSRCHMKCPSREVSQECLDRCLVSFDSNSVEDRRLCLSVPHCEVYFGFTDRKYLLFICRLRFSIPLPYFIAILVS